MFDFRRATRWVAFATIVAVIGFCSTQAPAGDNGNSNPGVLPPQSSPYGKTYGEWATEWWKWAFSISVPDNPLFDETGAKVAQGQSGHVWFLAGVINVSGTAERHVTVPPGKALFFPIANTECSTVEGNGTTEAELRACANAGADSVISMSAEIDGRAVQKLGGYRHESPLFTFGPLPDNNVLQFFGVDAPAGTTSPSVDAGYYLMLAPLSAGQHTLHFTASFSSGFTLDITYFITITPSGH
jgi:hypothetical protein